MKNQSGVTLAALATTIIVLVILLSITLSYGLDTLKEAREKNYQSEVEIVGQAVAEQYMKIVEMGMADLTTAQSSTQPGIFVGTRVTNIPSQMKNSSTVSGSNKYSQFYYRLTSDDLHKLKIRANGTVENTTSATTRNTYIVNYFTGEVLNEQRNTYYVGLRNGSSGTSAQQTQEGTTASFN